MSNQATRLSSCPAERLAQCRGQADNSDDQLQHDPAGISKQLPENCRQRLAAEGKSYAKSNCSVCGQFSPRWKECDAVLADAPLQPAGVVEVLGRVMGAGYDSQNRTVMLEIGNGDFPFARKIETGTELVDRAHVTRLKAEVSALQQRLNIADQRVCELEKDKQRLDALEGNFWDVRHHSAPLADTGDYTGGVEIVGRWMDKPHERVIGEDYNESLRAAIDQAMTADAYPPARPEYPEIDAALSEENWHMNPCRQGHGDVGACGGKAFCHTCDETITATTTQAAFEQWNSAHPPSAKAEPRCNEEREELGLPTNPACAACGIGSCFDR